MSSPLCNPRFLEHLKQSKAQTKDRMHLKTDRMIDRVYSEVLADLHKFFTFDDGLVRPREVQSNDTQFLSHSSQSTPAQVYSPPSDATIVPNVSQNSDHSIDSFQTLIPHSIVPTINQLPNISESVALEPNQQTSHSTITQLTIVKNEIDSDSEDNPTDYKKAYYEHGNDLEVDPKMEFNDDDGGDGKECECKDCLNDLNQLHQNTSCDKEDDDYEVDQETWDELGREIKEEMQERDNGESILTSTDTLDSRNAFDSFHPTENEHISKSNDGHSNQRKANETQYFEAHYLDEEIFCPSVKIPKLDSAQQPNEISQITGKSLQTQNQPQSTQPSNASTNEKKRNNIVINHIRNQHFTFSPHSVPNEAQLDPSDNVEVESNHQPGKSNHYKRLIILSLQCPVSNCFGTFPEDQLNSHLRAKHDLGPFRCLVKDCAQSFDNADTLTDHLNLAHKDTTEWHCGNCPRYFITYPPLSNHNQDFHQLGLFQCSYPSCTFTEEYRNKMYRHYRTKHRQTLICQNSICQYRTSSATILRQHELNHLGIKPYRCAWPECHYASASRSGTIAHIRGVHFLVRNPNAVPSEAQLRDPSEFLEVMHELLQMN